MINYDERPFVRNGHLELEVFIDRSVDKVWKRFIDMGSWVTSHRIEQIHGEPGAVGSIIRASFNRASELAMPLPHHHYCKIIKLSWEQQYLFKTYSESSGGSYGLAITGFDDTRFHSEDQGTRVTFNFYGEYAGEVVIKDPSDGDHMFKNLQNLKKLVEGS